MQERCENAHQEVPKRKQIQISYNAARFIDRSYCGEAAGAEEEKKHCAPEVRIHEAVVLANVLFWGVKQNTRVRKEKARLECTRERNPHSTHARAGHRHRAAFRVLEGEGKRR